MAHHALSNATNVKPLRLQIRLPEEDAHRRAVVAHETGYLDHKHGMGYHAHFGFEKEYRQGWEFFAPIKQAVADSERNSRRHMLMRGFVD